MVAELVKTILNIESPTGGEELIHNFTKDFLCEHYPDAIIYEFENSLICTTNAQSDKPHLALVGHTDVVPSHFEARIEDGKLYGSGASDMKGAVGLYLQLVKDLGADIHKNYKVSVVLYAKEEQTPMDENGLFGLIKEFPDFFKTVDLAIAGEPTDDEVHVGCVGSLHARFKVKGVACHSARPWNGENAIYNAVPFLTKAASFEPIKHTVFGVDFFDVMQVTELHAQAGRTSLPGWIEGNVNFRYAPVHTDESAQKFFEETLASWGLSKSDYELLDTAPAGAVIESDVFKTVVEILDRPVKAKQAWTDVAQFSKAGIPALNFGPGLTDQAHKENEFVPVENLERYYETLKQLLQA